MGKNKQGSLGAVVGIGLGLAAGWSLRKLLQKKYDETAGFLREPVSEKELITTVFGEYSKEAAEYYQQVRTELVNQFAQLQTSMAEIDTQKYRELVDVALKNIQQDKAISKSQINALREYLMDDFAHIKAKAKTAKRKIARKTSTRARKAASVLEDAADEVQE